MCAPSFPLTDLTNNSDENEIFEPPPLRSLVLTEHRHRLKSPLLIVHSIQSCPLRSAVRVCLANFHDQKNKCRFGHFIVKVFHLNHLLQQQQRVKMHIRFLRKVINQKTWNIIQFNTQSFNKKTIKRRLFKNCPKSDSVK